MHYAIEQAHVQHRDFHTAVKIFSDAEERSANTQYSILTKKTHLCRGEKYESPHSTR